MSKIPIVSLGRFGPGTMDMLESAFETFGSGDKASSEAALREHGDAIQAIAFFGQPVDAALMDRLPRLEIVSGVGAGYDRVDIDAAKARGIVVTYTPDVLNDEVADTAMGLLLMTVRDLAAAERYVRAGRWATDGAFPLSRASLAGRRLGIAGLGRIGKAIAARAAAFGLDVVYFGRSVQPEQPYRYYADLVAMARDVDILVAVLPSGADTRHLISAEVLAALGPEGVLINVGRGPTVDEKALIAALQNGTIMAAGLDVFENEPHVPAELVAMDNVVLLPHIGSASQPTRNRMGKLVVDNLKSWFADGVPITPVPGTLVPRRHRRD